jgi:hypothetical protein
MDLLLFNETQSRVIFSVSRENSGTVEKICAAAGVPLFRLGEVGGPELVISNGKETQSWEIAELYKTWYCSIEDAMAPNES